MEQNPNQTFRYDYSAGQQAEIQQIRQKYQPKEEDKLEKLRRLDAGVTRKGTWAAWIVGLMSCLILGMGMSCVMVFREGWFIPGIFIGIVGLLGVAAAYPLYTHITRKERMRLAPEILRLTEELMK